MSRSVGVGLAFYVVWMSLLLGGLFWGRQVALRDYAGPEAQAQWQDFREDMKRLGGKGPVQRRPPVSDEPPALRLMRDHFGVSLGATVVFGSLLYVMIWGAVRGACSEEVEPRD
jgi:hypothetical protein